jgi:type III pantothenate kinase
VLLCIDLGNTNITFGLYQGDDLGYHWRIKTDHHKMPDEYGILLLNLMAHAGRQPQDVTGICMCSVVPPLIGILDECCRAYFGRAPLMVDAGVETGVKIRYDNPSEVGADRVVDAAAVYRLYGGPACVVDFGTATTFDAISGEVHSMQSGMVFGYVGLVEGMVARFRQELGDDMRVVGTGGLVEVIARETDVIQEIDPWLTLRGLRIVWDLNQ